MEAEGIELFGKHGRNVLVAVDDEHMHRLRVEGLDPLDKVVMVGVGRKALEVDDLRLDGDLFAEVMSGVISFGEAAERTEQELASAREKAERARLQKEARFDDALDVITIDGVRVEWNDGFALARSSNTTPVVVLRLEGDTPEALERIKKTFAEVLLKVEPSLELPF